MRLLSIVLFCSIFLASCSNSMNANISTGNSSDIITLSHYPDCDYQVLGNVKGIHGSGRFEYYTKTATTSSLKFIGNQIEALQILKSEAKSLGADAIAIIDYDAVHQEASNNRGKTITLSKYIYRAQAIKLNCQNSFASINKINDKPVKYLEDGSFNLGVVLKNKSIIAVTPQEKYKPKKVSQLSDNKVFLDGVIFGFTFGQPKNEVLEKLGSPSAVINYNNEQQAYLFGRRHVFHFTEHQFVGYEYTNWLLPPHLNNQLEYHNTFDALDWVLEDTIKIGSPLAKLKQVLGIDMPLTSNNKFKIEYNNVQAEFLFLNQKNMYDDDKQHYQLNTISILQKGMKSISWQDLNKTEHQRDVIDFESNILNNLLSNSRNNILEKLGQPNAIIFKDSEKDVWLYGGNLQLKFFNDSVFRFSLVSSIELFSKKECQNCLYLGQLIEQLPSNAVQYIANEQYLLKRSGIEYRIFMNDSSDAKIVSKIEANISL